MEPLLEAEDANFSLIHSRTWIPKRKAEEIKIDQSTVSKTLKYESEKIMAILKFWIGTYALVNELLKILPHPNLH